MRNIIYYYVLLHAARQDVIILPSGTCIEGFKIFDQGTNLPPLFEISYIIHHEALPVLCANFHVRFFYLGATKRLPPSLAATIQHASMRPSAEVDYEEYVEDVKAFHCRMGRQDAQSACQNLLSRLCNLRSLDRGSSFRQLCAIHDWLHTFLTTNAFMLSSTWQRNVM